MVFIEYGGWNTEMKEEQQRLGKASWVPTTYGLGEEKYKQPGSWECGDECT